VKNIGRRSGEQRVMVFSSTVFLFVFLPLVLILYRFIPKGKILYQNIFLFLVSSFFYYYGEQDKILLMYFVILLNYLTARVVYSGKNDNGNYVGKTFLQKAAMFSCVAICIGLLWYYKYFLFSIDVFNTVFDGTLNYKNAYEIILPLGISFYTFHVLSYTLDVYFGRMSVEKNLLNFSAYVLMFPQLVAGPIVRYKDICHQFYDRVITGVGFVNGIRRFCYGLAKKVLIANTLAAHVDEVFAIDPNVLSWSDCWIGAIAYTLQIYFDFSGYSDMAIGLAMLFGFHYKENFNYPYIAHSASEFWRRWHISLSTWLRDYVYIHLGGSRGSSLKTYRNILLVFLCSGLWHGANITFVCWGLLYGIFIVIENMGLKKILDRCNLMSHIYLLMVVITGWVIFRADNMEYAKSFLYRMYTLNPSGLNFTYDIANNIVFAMILGIILSYDWRELYKKGIIFLAEKGNYRRVFFINKLVSCGIGVILFVLSVASIVSSSHNPFIYFRF